MSLARLGVEGWPFGCAGPGVSQLGMPAAGPQMLARGQSY